MKQGVLPLLVAAIVAVVCVGSTQASPVTLTEADFFVSDTLIDFESIARDEEITGQFSSLGVTFSGGLYGDDWASPPLMGSTVTASNFQSDLSGYYNPIAVAFSDPITRVGFYAIGNDPDTITVRTYQGATLTGSFTFDTSLTPSFLGVGDLAGIDSIQIEAARISNGVMSIDNLRFGGASDGASPVPAPGALLLACLGAGLTGKFARRKTA